jgi:hypothetical protein
MLFCVCLLVVACCCLALEKRNSTPPQSVSPTSSSSAASSASHVSDSNIPLIFHLYTSKPSIINEQSIQTHARKSSTTSPAGSQRKPNALDDAAYYQQLRAVIAPFYLRVFSSPTRICCCDAFSIRNEQNTTGGRFELAARQGRRESDRLTIFDSFVVGSLAQNTNKQHTQQHKQLNTNNNANNNETEQGGEPLPPIAAAALAHRYCTSNRFFA